MSGRVTGAPLAVEAEGVGPTAPPSALPDIAAIIEQAVRAANAPLLERLDKLERATPQQYRAMPPIPMEPRAPTLRELEGKSQGRMDYPMTVGGVPLNSQELDRYQQRFRVGSTFRINPDVVACSIVTRETVQGINPRTGKPHLDVETREETWGEVLARLNANGPRRCQNRQGKRRCPGVFLVGDSCPGCGLAPRITRVFWLDKEGTWKYAGIVPGLSGLNPTGFRDAELVAA